MGAFDFVNDIYEVGKGVGEDFVKNYQVSDVAEVVSDGNFFTDVFGYINENEWAANLLAGAATGAGAYMLQKDNQDFERQMQDRKYQQSLVQYGGGSRDYANMKGGLLASGKPMVRDFSRGR